MSITNLSSNNNEYVGHSGLRLIKIIGLISTNWMCGFNLIKSIIVNEIKGYGQQEIFHLRERRENIVLELVISDNLTIKCNNQSNLIK